MSPGHKLTFAVGLAGVWIKVVSIIARPVTPGRSLIQLNQFSLDELKRQNLVDLKGVVSLSTAMSFDDLFQRIRTKVESTARPSREASPLTIARVRHGTRHGSERLCAAQGTAFRGEVVQRCDRASLAIAASRNHRHTPL